MTDTTVAGSTRGRSYGLGAEDYQRYRPAPPAEAVEWVLPPSAETVVDLGAGTGAVTRMLPERCRVALAVEPDPRMVAVLRQYLPSVAVIAGLAEALPLADGSLDAVVIAGAWHWFDPVLATTELARVLRAGGTLAMLGSGIDPRERWAYDLVSGQRTPADAGPVPEPESEHYPPNLLPRGSSFGPAEVRRVPWSVDLTPDQVAGLAGTSTDTLSLDDDPRRQLLHRIASLARNHPQLDSRTGTIPFPLLCRCWKAIRL